MSRTLGLRKAALALMLTVVAMVTAGAQIDQDPTTKRPGRCTGGPFTLTAGKVRFHVADDGRAGGSPLNVSLRLLDAEGSIVARHAVQLAAGHTTTLEYEGAGLLRPQATFESAFASNTRRQPVSSVELFDVDGFRIIIPVQCIPNENIAR